MENFIFCAVYINYIILVPQVMELPRFKNKYVSFGKDQISLGKPLNWQKKNLKYVTSLFKTKNE